MNYCLLCLIDVNVIAIHVFGGVQLGTLFHQWYDLSSAMRDISVNSTF